MHIQEKANPTPAIWAWCNWLARLIWNQEVIGSSPIAQTNSETGSSEKCSDKLLKFIALF